MKKFIALFCFAMALSSGGNAETVMLSGSSISLEILSAAASTELADSLTATHTGLTAQVIAAIDTITATHGDLTARLAAIKGATGVFHEQADVPVNVTVIADSGITVLNLRTASTRYLIRNLRLKCADPGANTVTVSLYEFINDAFIETDTFEITTVNAANYFNLYDMFGETQLAGDNLMIMVQSSAGSYAVTGQYSYAKTNN